MKKTQELLKLRSKIIDEIYKKRWEEVWFFPSYKEVSGVKGFLGTAPIMFVSINPSCGTYPSRADLFYYRNLKRQGLANAHLTDVFKVKKKNFDVKTMLQDRKLIAEAKRFMKEELAIIQPRLLVFVGKSKSYKKFYESFFEDYSCTKMIIPHYAPRFANQKTRKRFRAALRRISEAAKR
jgi:hypothetical protein